MQRPLRSQSPKRVGSGPPGPPRSVRAGCAGGRSAGLTSAAATAIAAGARVGSTSEGTFGTGANSARIARVRPYETPAKTKMSTVVGVDLSNGPEGLGVLAFRG